MICITPTTIRNPKGDTGDGHFMFIEVPCKKCTPCLKRRSQQWAFRLKWEEKRSTTAAFMTYTYSKEHLPYSEHGFETLHPRHHTLFMKRLRKETKTKLKYYMVGEYGGEMLRPHYHSILFNLPQSYIENPEKIEKIWKHGIITADKVTPASIAYVCGYVNKQKFFTTSDPLDDRLKEYSLMSKHLGENFLTIARVKKMKEDLEPTIKIEGGQIMSIPQYYRKKVLTNEERRLVSDKTNSYVRDNPVFKDEKQHSEYVQHSANMREKNAKIIRQL